MSYTLKYSLSIWSSILLLRIFPREIKLHVSTIVCTTILTEALSIIVKNLKQHKCVSLCKDRHWRFYTKHANIIYLDYFISTLATVRSRSFDFLMLYIFSVSVPLMKFIPFNDVRGIKKFILIWQETINSFNKCGWAFTAK